MIAVFASELSVPYMSKIPPIEEISEDPNRVEELIEVVGSTADPDTQRYANPSTELIRKLEMKVSNGHVFGDIFHLRSSLAGIDRPCLAIRDDGRIVTQNYAAEVLFDMKTVDWLDDSDLYPIEKNSWSEVLAHKKPNAFNQRKQRFFKAHLALNGTDYFVVLVPTRMQVNNEYLSLLLLIDTLWDDTLKAICIQNYGLTAGELSVVEKFVNGSDLREIAELSNRSIATIRKHFYSALEKFEVVSQTDLLRELFSFSNLLEISKPIANRYDAPRRSRASILRPDGRTLEMYISGNRKGAVILSFSDPSHLVFRPENEDLLFDLGICMIVLVRPGYGTTSPPPDGVTYEECIAQDVSAVLDQLEITQVPLFAPHVSFVTALRVLKMIPERISQVISTLVLPPAPYLESKKQSGAVARLAFNVVHGNKTAAVLALRVAADALSVLGARKVFAILLDNKAKKDNYDDQKTIAVLDEAIKSVVAQGSKAVAEDYMRVFTDWTDLIEQCPVPITIFREPVSLFMEDDVFDRFLDDFRDKVECQPAKNGEDFCFLFQRILNLGEDKT